MRKGIEEVLGSEYSVAIETEVEKLKQSERMLIGDIVAVVERSDRFMGRPSEDCSIENENIYVIFYPSKYSVVCQKDIQVIKAANSNIKLMSLNYFVEQLLEFNFTFLQLLNTEAVKYESADFIKLRREVNEIIKNNSRDMYKKQISMIHSVMKDINSAKFKDKQLENRLFIIFKVIEMLSIFNTHSVWNINSTINCSEYNRIVKRFDSNVLNELNKKLGILIEVEKNTFGENYKNRSKEDKLNDRYNLLNSVIRNVLEVN